MYQKHGLCKYLQQETSNIRHEDFRPPPSVRLRVPPLKSETGWTGELWSNPATTTTTPMSRSGYPPLDSERGWTGELWLNPVLLILKN